MRLDDYTSSTKPVPRGLPQGSPLLVILYILYNSDLLHLQGQESSNTISIGYIDDVVHLTADQRLENAIDMMSNIARRSLDWGRRHAAVFDEHKSQIMILTKARTISPPTTEFPLGNTLLPFTATAKWLGLTIDNRLSYHQHIGDLLFRGQSTLKAVGRLGNSRWGLMERDRAKLLDAVLMPRITYAAHVWARSKNLTRLRTVTNKLDRACAKFAKGIFRTTDSKWLEQNYSHSPVLEAIMKSSFLFFTRKLTLSGGSADIRTNLLDRLTHKCTLDDSAINQGICRTQLLKFVSMQAEQIEVQLSARPFPPPCHVDYHNLDLTKPEATKATLSFINQTNSEDAFIFTDGSYDKEKGGGAAAIMLNTNSSLLVATGKNVLHSNHECEILGILAAF